MQRRGKKTEKFFSDNGYGGKRAALQAAKEFRDELESESRKYMIKRIIVPTLRPKSIRHRRRAAASAKRHARRV